MHNQILTSMSFGIMLFDWHNNQMHDEATHQ
jgi:hypothetical protein